MKNTFLFLIGILACLSCDNTEMIPDDKAAEAAEEELQRTSP